MPAKHKTPSPEALAVRDTLKEVEFAQYMLYKAMQRHHEACAVIADKYGLDPDVMATGGPGGDK